MLFNQFSDRQLWGIQENYVNPDNLEEDKPVKDETMLERVKRQQKHIVQLQKENIHLKAELQEFEHLMKQYTLGLQ